MNIIQHYTIGITFAICPFVVLEDDLGDSVREPDGVDYFGSDDGMLFDGIYSLSVRLCSLFKTPLMMPIFPRS
jgi:hypothetical protein